VEEARRSNTKHRPIGLGVQGLADTFLQMNYSFDSEEAQELNKQIFETIYFASLTESMELAKEEGQYETFKGSPASEGMLQFDLWKVKPSGVNDLWDWDTLKQDIKRHGLRNSLLIAPMPTASTAQILGYNECIEPYTSNIYVRRVKAGEFIVVNPHLLKELFELNLWNADIRNRVIANGGSIQNIPEISDEMKSKYRTVWEIKQKSLIDMAAGRGPYVDQSQSLNVFLAQPDHSQLTSLHFYGWKSGLKTGMYYLRTKPAANAIQFTVDSTKLSSSIQNDEEKNRSTPLEEANKAGIVCTDEVCLSCQG